jgi:hypothetical protein
VTASINGSPFLPLTFNALTGYWDSTGSNFFSIPPQAGPLTVDLKWDESIGTEGGNTCKIGNGNKCNGVFASVQRTFAALNSRSGPIQQAIVSENGSQWTNSFQIGTSHNLAVTIGVKGSLGDAASVGDPVVDLRVVGGSRTQSLDCQPNSNLRDEIRLGCTPTYSKNTGQPCPSNLWSTPQPWNCVLVQTGTSIGQVSQGMQDRILCGGQNCQGNPSCTAPNNWSQFPNLPAGDPRIIPVFLTPFGSFNDSGSGVVPVTNFAMFYVTGWGGNGGSSDPCPNADQVPTGDIAGHFIKYVDSLPKNQDGSQFCDFNAFGNCFTVLTR